MLRLYNVTEKDEGWYTCIAQNALGETFSSAYLRVVESKCTIETYSESLSASRNWFSYAVIAKSWLS